MRETVFALLVVLLASAAAEAQSVRGRVVDDGSRQGVRDAVVSLLDSAGAVVSTTETDANGFFLLRARSAGVYGLTVLRIGYGEHRGDVRLGEGERTIPAIVLKSEAIPLDPVRAEARAQRGGAAPAGMQRPSHILAGERMAMLERQGGRLISAVRDIGSLRVREWTERDGRARTCVESIRAIPMGLQPSQGGQDRRFGGGSDSNCQWVAIVVDGIVLDGDKERTFRNLYLADYESLEYLPPAEAGQLYGMEASAAGALVLWSRGRGPHISEARNRR